MKPIAICLLIASVAGLAACGKSEEAAAPVTPPPAAEAPPADASAAPAAEATTPVEAPAPEAAPTASEASPAPAPAAAPAAKSPAPAPVNPAPSSPAPAATAAAPAQAPVADLIHGQKIYRQACAFCHDRGVAGAPKTGDAAIWSARLAQGMDTLYTVAIRGKGAMPARGGNPSLSDADVIAAVDYMIAQSR